MLGDIYGPKDHRNKLIPYLLENENNRLIVLKNNSKSEIFLVNIVDIFNFIESYKYKKGFERVDLVGEKKSLLDIVNIYKKSRNKNFGISFGNQSYFSIEYDSLSNKKISDLINLEDGFKKL